MDSPSTVDCFKCGSRIPWVTRNTRFSKSKGWAHRICPRRRLRRGERKRRKVIRYRYGTPDFIKTNLKHVLQDMTDPRSYVTLDTNREILYGEDWKRRREECFERDKGKCQWVEESPWVCSTWIYPSHGAVCGNPANDADHIIKRSKQRDDRLSNLRSLCRFHHNLRHKEHRTRFHET